MQATFGVLAFIVGSVLAASSAAAATAQRSFVSAAGVDSPTCSLGTPCRSFDAAIAATNPAGEIIVLDAAGYGAVAVTKALAIIAAPGIYAGISVFAGSGVTINAPTATVVLRGLAINGQGGGRGIEVQDAARVRIENCQIAGMTQYAILATGGSELVVSDTTLRDNAGAGIRVSPATTDISVLIERVRSEHNGTQGLYLVPGVSSGTVHASVSVADSTFAYNGADGVYIGNAANGDVSFDLVRSTSTHNGGNGVQLENASTTAVTRASLTQNDMSGNMGRGFLESGSGSGGSIEATLARNTASNNGADGIGVAKTGTIATAAMLTGNTASANQRDGIRMDGVATMYLAANVALGNSVYDLDCHTESANMISLGDNFTASGFSAKLCFSTKTGT